MQCGVHAEVHAVGCACSGVFVQCSVLAVRWGVRTCGVRAVGSARSGVRLQWSVRAYDVLAIWCVLVTCFAGGRR